MWYRDNKNLMNWFPRIAVIQHQKQGGFKQQKVIDSQFWRITI